MAAVWISAAAVAVFSAVVCASVPSPVVKVQLETPYQCRERHELELRWNETRAVKFDYALRHYTVKAGSQGVKSASACREWCLDGKINKWQKYRLGCLMYKYDPRERRCVLYTKQAQRTVKETRTGIWNCYLKANKYYLPMEDIIDHVDRATSVKTRILLGHHINGSLQGNVELVHGKVGFGLKLSSHPINVFLGNRAHECFGSLELCNNGMTIAMWTKERQEEERLTYGRIFHSHEVTIYLVRGRFFAVFQTPRRMWSIAAPLQEKRGRRHDLSHEWHHVVLTWHPKKGLKLYINGELRKESAGEFWEQGAAGKLSNDSSIGEAAPHKNGSVIVDEVRFWNVHLDKVAVEGIFEWESRPRMPSPLLQKEEVKAKRNFSTAPGMKYYMPMDRLEEGKVLGDAINGTAGKQIQSYSNRGHKAMAFYGRSIIDLGDRHNECFGNIDLCFRGFSMSLWVTPQRKQRTPSMFYALSSGGKRPSTAIAISGDSLSITVQSRHLRRAWRFSHRFSYHEKKSGWVHIALTWDRGYMRVYINGKQHLIRANYWHRLSEVPNAETHAQMGLRYVERRKRGRKVQVKSGEAIDQVRFWERNLSEREASSIFGAEEEARERMIRRSRRKSKRRHKRQRRRNKSLKRKRERHSM